MGIVKTRHALSLSTEIMTPFINQISDILIARHGSDLKDICIVAPNRRAGVFLRKQLADKIGETVWAPEFTTIDDFIFKYSGFRKAERIDLIFKLFDIHLQLDPEPREVDDFFSFAELLIGDFNEIDLYLKDPKQVFQYLDAVKAIQLWSPRENKLSEFQEKYLQFYHQLYDYYLLLSQRLLGDHTAYHGFAYRRFAENLSQIESQIPYKKIYFIGFNAISASEEKIIKYLVDTKKAEAFWDADDYYLLDQRQEAGLFLRREQQIFGTQGMLSQTNFEEEKEIQIVGVPKDIGQVKYAAQLLDAEYSKYANPKFDNESTALVLANEHLLLPFLNSIPDSFDAVNVTMGYPLQHAAPADLFLQIFTLHETSQKEEGKPQRFYVPEILKIIDHPFVENILHQKEKENFKHALLQSNRAFLTAEEIETLTGKNHEIFSSLKHASDVLELCVKIVNRLQESFPKDENFLFERSCLFAFSKMLNVLKTRVEPHRERIGFKAVRNLFKQLLVQTSVPLQGDPLHGLQLMGLLETRTLDFDNVVLVGVNEGILPLGKMESSFIPFDLKIELGLPTHREKDAVFAYHFYRLIQRAKRVTLIYNTEVDPLSGGEKSRFILQLQNEMQRKYPNVKITNKLVGSKPDKEKLNDGLTVSKTENVLQSLRDTAAYGFSATALSDYIACPLRFYFARVLRIPERSEINEFIDAKTLGSVVHDTLKFIYDQQLKTPLSIDFIEENNDKIIREQIEKSFAKHYPKGNLTSGKNFLIASVAGMFVKNFLKKEKELLAKGNRINVFANEEAIDAAYVLGEDKIPLRFRGSIDRIDEFNGRLRILDYKTGEINVSQNLKFPDWPAIIQNPDYAKAFQLLFYAFVYTLENPKKVNELEVANISFRALKDYDLTVETPDGSVLNKDILKNFENVLNHLLNEIFNPEISFKPAEDKKNCKYCNYAEICTK